MYSFRNKLLLSFLSVLFSFSLYAHNESTNVPFQDKLAKAIVQNSPNLIQNFQNGKLYLDGSSIASSSKGLYLDCAGTKLALPVLLSDNYGCYIPIGDSGIQVICENCGYEFEITELVTYCPNCQHGKWPKLALNHTLLQ